jgi:hypothetical protein
MRFISRSNIVIAAMFCLNQQTNEILEPMRVVTVVTELHCIALRIKLVAHWCNFIFSQVGSEC